MASAPVAWAAAPASLAAVDTAARAPVPNGEFVTCMDVHSAQQAELESVGSSGVVVEDVGAKLDTLAPLSIVDGGSTTLVCSGIVVENVAAKLDTLTPLSIIAGGSTTLVSSDIGGEDVAAKLDSLAPLSAQKLVEKLAQNMAVELRSWRVGCGLLTEADAKAEEREFAVRNAHWAGATEAQRLAEVDRIMLRHASLSVAADEPALPAVVAEEDALAPRCRAKGRRRR